MMLDLRSLAVTRILLGLIILQDRIGLFLDWLRGSGDFPAFFSEVGLIPARYTLTAYSHWLPSFHLAIPGDHWQLLFLLVSALLAFALVLGWNTKTITVLLWLALLSEHNRIFVILKAPESILRLSLFLGIFLPWGSVFSWDAKRAHLVPRPHPVAECAWILQIAAVYVVSAGFKLYSPEWVSGQGVWGSLSSDKFILPAGAWVLGHPVLLEVLNYFVLAIEYLAPVLLVFPLAWARTRVIGAGLLMLMHVGFMSCLYLGNFPLISLSLLFSLLPFRTQNSGRPQRLSPLALAVLGLFCVNLLFSSYAHLSGKELRFGLWQEFSLSTLFEQRWIQYIRDPHAEEPFPHDPTRRKPWLMAISHEAPAFNLLSASGRVYWESSPEFDYPASLRWRQYLTKLASVRSMFPMRARFFGRYACGRFKLAGIRPSGWSLYYLYQEYDFDQKKPGPVQHSLMQRGICLNEK